jgi:hypothetical protein
MRWYLLVLVTGEHPAIPGARKPFSWHCTSFRYTAPGPLRAFLHQQAQASLARHGITEPVTWEPPAHWVTWEDWPGTDPASLAGDDLAAVLAKTGSVDEAASAIRLTPEHVRLYCEIAGTGPPPATANGLPVSESRASTLSPARLRDLYEHQNLPMTDIAAMAGCATATIRRLLKIDGVAQRTAYRRPPPESGITREWLHHEYVVKLRSIDSLARERGVTAPYLKSLARNWGLPIRRHSDFSGIGHLNLPAPPSPAMRAVTMRTGALSRAGADHPDPRPRQHRRCGALPLRRARRRPAADDRQDRDSRRVPHHRQVRHAFVHDGRRPRLHLRSTPDPPGRPGADEAAPGSGRET